MAALAGGDDASLSALMDRWELGVKAFLLQLGVAKADVEDVAQEAFVRLYQKRTSYRAGEPFRPWLFTLAANLGRNRIRWRSRRREEYWEASHEAPQVGSEETERTTRSTSSLVEEEDLHRLVREAVAGLPEPLREAVRCVDLAQLNHQEAAQVLGCSSKAIETRLHRARRKLQETLARFL